MGSPKEDCLTDKISAVDDAAPLLDDHAPDDQTDGESYACNLDAVAGLLNDEDEENDALTSVRALFSSPPVPLLPRPAAPVSEVVQALSTIDQDPTAVARRSERLGTKPCMPVMDKAI